MIKTHDSERMIGTRDGERMMTHNSEGMIGTCKFEGMSRHMYNSEENSEGMIETYDDEGMINTHKTLNSVSVSVTK